MDLRLVDDVGVPIEAADDETIGEIEVRGPNLFDGYLNRPDATREAMHDGWFRTGDLATIDPDGWVRITGRKRERILRGGHSVFPSEVESVLVTHPDVAEAAVVGVPHAELGEDIAAFVVLRPGAGTTADALVAHCRERLAGYKYPRRVTLMAALPRSSTGKVLKAKLAAET